MPFILPLFAETSLAEVFLTNQNIFQSWKLLYLHVDNT